MQGWIVGGSRRAPRWLVLFVLPLAFALATFGSEPARAEPARAEAGRAEPAGAEPGGAVAGEPAAPDSSARSSWAYDLAGELMSPFCPGRTLAACPSPQAGELIQWIATQEAAGATREDVVRMLVERFGEDVLGTPPAKGIGLWARVLPVLGFLGFGGIALLVLRRIVAPAARARGGAGSPPAPAAAARPLGGAPRGASEELARIVDAELEERA